MINYNEFEVGVDAWNKNQRCFRHIIGRHIVNELTIGMNSIEFHVEKNISSEGLEDCGDLS